MNILGPEEQVQGQGNLPILVQSQEQSEVESTQKPCGMGRVFRSLTGAVIGAGGVLVTAGAMGVAATGLPVLAAATVVGTSGAYLLGKKAPENPEKALAKLDAEQVGAEQVDQPAAQVVAAPAAAAAAPIVYTDVDLVANITRVEVEDIPLGRMKLINSFFGKQKLRIDSFTVTQYGTDADGKDVKCERKFRATLDLDNKRQDLKGSDGENDEAFRKFINEKINRSHQIIGRMPRDQDHKKITDAKDGVLELKIVHQGSLKKISEISDTIEREKERINALKSLALPKRSYFVDDSPDSIKSIEMVWRHFNVHKGEITGDHLEHLPTGSGKGGAYLDRDAINNLCRISHPMGFQPEEQQGDGPQLDLARRAKPMPRLSEPAVNRDEEKARAKKEEDEKKAAEEADKKSQKAADALKKQMLSPLGSSPTSKPIDPNDKTIFPITGNYD